MAFSDLIVSCVVERIPNSTARRRNEYRNHFFAWAIAPDRLSAPVGIAGCFKTVITISSDT